MVYEFDEISGFRHDYAVSGDYEMRISGAASLRLRDNWRAADENWSITGVAFGDGVTDIEDGCCAYCWQLISVVLPDSVSSIGDMAFYQIDQCGRLDLPSSLVRIGAFAFADNYISAYGLPPKLREIPYGCFYHNLQLRRMEFPPSVSCISLAGFQMCYQLSSVSFNDGLSSIYDRAFLNCNMRNVSFPGTLRYLGAGAFGLNARLSSASFPPSALEIVDGNPFYGCSALTSYRQIDFRGDQPYVLHSAYGVLNRYRTLVIPLDEPFPEETAYQAPLAIGERAYSGNANVSFCGYNTILTGIHDFAFESCRNLSGVSLGEQVQLVGQYAFANCDLRTVRWKSSAARVQRHTFENNRNLVSAEFPPSVSAFGYCCFDGCSALYRLVLSGDYAKAPVFESNSVPAGVAVIVKDAATSAMFASAVPSGVKVYHLGQVEMTQDLSVDPIPDTTYTGYYQKPEVTVRSSTGYVLQEIADYTLAYADNAAVGKAGVTITGRGPYIGDKTVYFNILPADISKGTAEFAE